MRIGISVRGSRNQDFWRDGASQHAIFLAAAFVRLPFVDNVLLIDVGGECRLPPAVDLAALGIDIVTQQQASEEINVIVELTGGLDGAWLDLMRSRGCKVVRCRNGAVPVDYASPQTDRYDELWLLPKDALVVPLMRALYRCPVRVVPFVWSPMFVASRVAALEPGGVYYGYDAVRQVRESAASGWRIAAFEPDRPAVSEPGIPMLACENAYRKQRDAISALHVLNATRMKTASKRARLAATFDLVRDGLATFRGPSDLVEFVATHADAVFSHQQNDGDAYGCLDVLYGDYPLIHNSPWLLDAGYYYPGADAQQGARVLLAALHCHDATLDAYRARSHAMFAAIDPFGEANLARYAEALSSPGIAHDAP